MYKIIFYYKVDNIINSNSISKYISRSTKENRTNSTINMSTPCLKKYIFVFIENNYWIFEITLHG